MTYAQRISDISKLLWDHAHPTLRSMDQNQIAKLTAEILRLATDRGLWTKWSSSREEIAHRAAILWIPLEDLRAALNGLPGPALTKVDVEQRLRDYRDKRYGSYPIAEIEAEALAAFAEESAKGTEFIALLGYMEEWSSDVEERLRLRREKNRRGEIAQEKKNAEARLRSGADCPWTEASGIKDIHCCKNSRLYRLRVLQPINEFEPALEVLRVDYLEAKKGRTVGRYRTKGDASKAVANAALRGTDL